MKHIPSQCPMCGGKVERGTTTFTVDLTTGVVVVRNVPVFICTQCGEDWIENQVSIKLDVVSLMRRYWPGA